MNDNDRAALVDKISDICADAYLTGYHQGKYKKEVAAKNDAERIIALVKDRLLAERQETTVPDAERVERAADAIYDYLANSYDLDEMIGEVELRIAARESAKVALAAAGPEADWLDAALESVHREAVLGRMFQLRLGGWEARITVPDGPDENGWYDYTGNEVVGTGPTRTAAIKDAIATALAAKQEGDER